jgi:hypothetical protein
MVEILEAREDAQGGGAGTRRVTRIASGYSGGDDD